MGQYIWVPEAFTLLSHWTGQDDWSSYKPPELSTGSCVVSETAVSRFHPFVFLLHRDLEGVTSTDRTGDLPTFLSTGENTHTKP